MTIICTQLLLVLNYYVSPLLWSFLHLLTPPLVGTRLCAPTPLPIAIIIILLFFSTTGSDSEDCWANSLCSSQSLSSSPWTLLIDDYYSSLWHPSSQHKYYHHNHLSYNWTPPPDKQLASSRAEPPLLPHPSLPTHCVQSYSITLIYRWLMSYPPEQSTYPNTYVVYWNAYFPC